MLFQLMWNGKLLLAVLGCGGQAHTAVHEAYQGIFCTAGGGEGATLLWGYWMDFLI